MKIVEFNVPGTKEGKKQIIEDIEKHDSFVIIYFDRKNYCEISHHHIGMTPYDIITACEIVKHTHLRDISNNE